MSERVESVELKDGVLFVTKRKSSGVMLTVNPPRIVPDKVWQEVYAVVDGKIALIETVHAKHIPATPERFTFDDQVYQTGFGRALEEAASNG